MATSLRVVAASHLGCALFSKNSTALRQLFLTYCMVVETLGLIVPSEDLVTLTAIGQDHGNQMSPLHI